MKKSQPIVLVGGGSGGHVTPIVFVAESIKKNNPKQQVIYLGKKGDRLNHVIENNPDKFDKIITISAGKFRRYHSEGILKKLLDIKTNFKNFVDMFRIFWGFFESIYYLIKFKPKSIFFRGSFVGVMPAKAARILGIDYYIHDSDIIPSLANRLTAKHAKKIFVTFDTSNYQYPKAKMLQTGLPLSSKISDINRLDNSMLKKELKLPTSKKILLVTGGGLGAARLNSAVLDILPNLAKNNIYTILQTGELHNEDIQSKIESEYAENIKILGFVDNQILLKYAKLADAVVSRAGMTSIAEYAALSKPLILVPNNLLTGGHQTKNALQLAKQNSAIVVTEDKYKELLPSILTIINDKNKAKTLGHSLSEYFTNNISASDTIAKILLVDQGAKQ